MHLEIMLLEFLFIELLVFLKTILKAKNYCNYFFFYYSFINPISYGESSSTTPLRFFVRNLFSVRAITLNFLTFIFML